jgi:hypothetical protein
VPADSLRAVFGNVTEPPLELNPVFGGTFAGLEFVQGGFGTGDEDFVMEN